MKFEVKNLSLSYKDGEDKREIFNDISFSFKEKERIVIVGPSGTGKSSLLYMISGLRTPDVGEIIYDGKVIQSGEIALNIRYTDFGFVFQQHYLIPYLNVLDNICIARRDCNLKEEAMQILTYMGMEKMAAKRPFELSGGEKQRVAIARAIVKKPKIIFADEPTASLDSRNAKLIYNLLREFSQQATLVIATHDKSILDGDERMFNIRDKKLIEGII